MKVIYDKTEGASGGRIMLVMLPGAGDRPEDMIANGFVRVLRNRTLPVDVALPYAGMDYYLDSSIVERLEADIIVPARCAGYTRFWLMGISLGGLGAAAYASEYPGKVEGMALIAPFLGMRGVIADVLRAGGLDGWQRCGHGAGDLEHRLLEWLKEYRADAAGMPEIYLGYGTDDRFAPTSTMLAQRLPADRVIQAAGGHDWPTWRALWDRMLDRGVLSSHA